MHLSELPGKTFGGWKVASVHATQGAYPWCWLVKVSSPETQVRLSVKGLVERLNRHTDDPVSDAEERRTRELADLFGW